jgi:hypothetical protein
MSDRAQTFDLMHKIQAIRGLDGTAKSVLFALALRAGGPDNPPDVCFPGLGTIALDTGWSATTVKITIRRLEATGWIDRFWDRRYKSKVTRLTLDGPRTGSAVGRVRDTAPSRAGSRADRVQDEAGGRQPTPGGRQVSTGGAASVYQGGRQVSTNGQRMAREWPMNGQQKIEAGQPEAVPPAGPSGLRDEPPDMYEPTNEEARETRISMLIAQGQALADRQARENGPVDW